MAEDLFSKRCLSVQSHVVHGYVGNKAATFPLQLAGFDVDSIASVQLSNHTAYATAPGTKLAASEMQAIMDGLQSNGLLAYSHVLSGYISSPELLRMMRDLVAAVREVNPDVVYVCDPVMGDHGKLYVPPTLVEVYKNDIVPIATILTPNQFEAQLLSGVTISDMDTAWAAIDVLHARGPKTVIITSTDFAPAAERVMYMLVSCPWDSVSDAWDTVFAGVDRSACAHARFMVSFPKLDSVFTGSGDLTAALLLAHSHALPHDLTSACERALASVQAVCRATRDYYAACVDRLRMSASAEPSATAPAGSASAASSDTSGTGSTPSATPRSAWMATAAASSSGQMGSVIPVFNELRLIQSRDVLERPPLLPGMVTRACC